jgi:hypothetical protein
MEDTFNVFLRNPDACIGEIDLHKFVIKNHSAMLDVHGNEGGGTVFRIIFPSIKAKPCWQEIGCKACLKDMKTEDCPVFKRAQGHRCWEILGAKERRESDMPVPNCHVCPLFQKRKRLAAWDNSKGLAG